MSERFDRRTFIAAAGASLAAASLAQEAKDPKSAADDAPKLTHGPFFTQLDLTHASVWARASRAGEYEFDAFAARWDHRVNAKAIASEDNDFTLRWSVQGLTAAEYEVHVRTAGREVDLGHFSLPARNPRDVTTLVLGSCVDERKFPDQPFWKSIADRRPDLLVLLGDTPYIDSTELAVQRERYRALYAQPQFAELVHTLPFTGVWDDHDFGGNDLFGAIAGRERSRRAFLEYHGDGAWGDGDQGVYSRRRIGPIELFLLDTRWFADTEPSPFDAEKKTLLGAAQLRWLQKGLLESDAPFKVLASGMIWNDATRPGKTDYWGHWPHERDGLFRWLGEKKIRGVVLVGGDIHRTRVVQHATKDVVGYDLLELITSPLANSVIEAADASHPGLLFDAGVEHSFLELSAREEVGSLMLHVEHLDGAGKRLYWLERYASNLAPK